MGKLAHWDAKVAEEWGVGYPRALSDYLGSLGVCSILDCAGGTGFPVIELKRLGWDVSYSDGMDESVEFFRVKKADLDIPTFKSLWSELPQTMPMSFDALLCRGNSLSSNIEFEPGSTHSAQARQRIVEDLRGMHSVLNPKGVLLVDVCNPEHARPPNKIVQQDTYFGGETVTLELSYDADRDVKVSEYFNVQGQLMWRFESVPIESSELFDLLDGAGFVDVAPASTPEPKRIEAWVARKA